MALRDTVSVLVDQGERSPVKHEVRVGSNGGTVSWERTGGFVEVHERTRNGGVVRSLAFAEPRVISVAFEPGR